MVYCNSKITITITHNLLLHNRTNIIEVDKHFIKEKMDAGVICFSYLQTVQQTTDMLTEGLSNKLDECWTSLYISIILTGVFRIHVNI